MDQGSRILIPSIFFCKALYVVTCHECATCVLFGAVTKQSTTPASEHTLSNAHLHPTIQSSLMLPFVFALIFAVGLPFLPSSLYRALHLPTLKFNLLSARHAPVRLLAPSTATTPFLENN